MSPLLRALADPASANRLDPRGWDQLIGEARATRLLGRLSYLLENAGGVNIPTAVADALLGSRIQADYLQVHARHDLERLQALPEAIGAPVVLLKGIAYVAADLPVARGRSLSDIDIMVPKASLARCESYLRDQGWRTDPELTAYDERYYREWSHELPPMRHPDFHFELDVHHALVQPTNRLAFDAQPLFSRAQALPDSPFLRLCDEDMLLNIAVHLLVSDEPRGGLRDLDDFARLFQGAYPESVGLFNSQLYEHARTLRLGSQLACTAQAAESMLGRAHRSEGPGPWRGPRPSRLTSAAIKRSLSPALEPGCYSEFARVFLFLRAHWLRMPLPLLVRHSLNKLRSQNPAA